MHSPRDFAGEDPLVLVANDIAPADMLKFRHGVFTGFVTDVGGRNSHTAIVARSMDIPAVVGAREASRIVSQTTGSSSMAMPASSSSIHRPSCSRNIVFANARSSLYRARLDRLRNTPAVTLDGQPIELLANIELPSDAQAVLDAGAVGVGLFRSEFLFMNRVGRLPGEEEQYEAYSRVVQALAGLPVTIRTVDIGADKQLDRTPAQEARNDHNLNPALGLRAIRWSLAEPEMFGEQLRAILRASAHGKVRLLVPMVAQLREVRQLLDAIHRAKAQLRARGQAYVDVALGAMIEVPAAALMLPTLLKHFDFVSIGTNDLIQYTLAIDRADEAVSHLYDPWHPGRAATHCPDHRQGERTRQGSQRLRGDGGRPGLHGVAARHGIAQLLHASHASVLDQEAHPARGRVDLERAHRPRAGGGGSAGVLCRPAHRRPRS